MFIHWIIMVAVVLSNFCSNSNDKFIYKETFLNQSNAVIINVSVSVMQLDGLLAYILTTQPNSRYHSIVMKFDGEEIHISFNAVTQKANVSSFCKCSTCMKTKLHFVVSYSQSNIEFVCNGIRSMAFNRNSYVTHSLDSNIYPFPTKWDEGRKIFAWIGNVGPFSGSNNKTWLPLKSQLRGCIEHLQIGAEIYLDTSTHIRCGSDVCGLDTCISLGGNFPSIASSIYSVSTETQMLSRTTAKTQILSRTTTAINGQNMFIFIIMTVVATVFFLIIVVVVLWIRSGFKENRIQSAMIQQLVNLNIQNVQPVEMDVSEIIETRIKREGGYDSIGPSYLMIDEVLQENVTEMTPQVFPRQF